MALYNPSTGKWYEYTEPTEDSYDSSYNLIRGTGGKLTEVASPSNAGNTAQMVDPNSRDAYGLAATLLRSQFSEWQSIYKPIELKALSNLSFNNPEVLSKAVSEAETMAAGSSGAMRGVIDRQNAALGITPTEGQKATINRVLDLDRAAAVAAARNEARTAVREQDEQILLGTMPNYNIAKGVST